MVDLDRLRSRLVDGFRVIAADLPGSGRSLPQPREYHADYYQEDAPVLLGLLDHLGITQAHLVGFSDGGEEALLMAALWPDRALSVATWGAVGQIFASPEELTALATIVDKPVDPFVPLVAYLVEAYGVDGARVMTSSLARAMGDIVARGGDLSRSRAADISCPVLLVNGTHDFLAPPEPAQEFANAIPRGEFREAVGAGHDVHHSHGDWLEDTLLGWLAEH
ncbi:alpha/beta fold hydrolase [Tenggerimyces flavus]|uniref:Alpha/beta fold hydrolase n=1 Tax=Tenggerimyces flavus TaxID=1708749 RepID=A0ABV7YJI8_9ACTN|nr:alpha/beta fold hydrolase [Tenggerimyces flavus]